MEKPGEPPKHAKGLKESAMAGSKRKLSQRSEDKRDDGLTRKLAGFLRAIKALADPYRPELHYMRGPGPKYHAKHNGSRESIDNHAGPRQHAGLSGTRADARSILASISA